MISAIIIISTIGIYAGLAVATMFEDDEACKPETCDKCGNPGPVTFQGRRMCVDCYKAYLNHQLILGHEGE